MGYFPLLPWLPEGVPATCQVSSSSRHISNQHSAGSLRAEGWEAFGHRAQGTNRLSVPNLCRLQGLPTWGTEARGQASDVLPSEQRAGPPALGVTTLSSLAASQGRSTPGPGLCSVPQGDLALPAGPAQGTWVPTERPPSKYAL